MKRLTALLILSILLTSALLASCGSKPSGSETASSSASITEETASEAAQTASNQILPDIPDIKFGGRDFNIVTYSTSGNNYVFTEEQNGDILNDAIFNRNALIEEKYDVKFNFIFTGDDISLPASHVSKSVTANDNSVDFAFNNCANAMTLTLGGYLSELTDVPYVDITKPWWDQGSVNDLSIGGRHFFAVNSLCLISDNLTSVMYFNKTLAEEFKLGDMYSLVRENKWTYPAMYELSKAVSSDLNGDGVMDDMDRYGVLTAVALMTDGMLNGGEPIFKKNSSDLPELSIGNSNSERIAEFFYNLLADTGNVLVCNRYSGKYNNAWFDLLYPAFEEGRGMFLAGYTQYVIYFRDSDVDYGILPRPKFDENQERYYSQINYYWSNTITVPIAVSDLECCGIILEALAAESLYSVTPASYEVTIVNKQLRDADSKEMLEIANSSRFYDYGQFATKLTSINTDLCNMAQSAKSYNFTSIIEKNRSAVDKGIQNLIDSVNSLE